MCVCDGVQGQVYDQGQLAALYSQQHLSEHLNVGGLSDSERPAFNLQNLNYFASKVKKRNTIYNDVTSRVTHHAAYMAQSQSCTRVMDALIGVSTDTDSALQQGREA